MIHHRMIQQNHTIVKIMMIWWLVCLIIMMIAFDHRYDYYFCDAFNPLSLSKRSMFPIRSNDMMYPNQQSTATKQHFTQQFQQETRKRKSYHHHHYDSLNLHDKKQSYPLYYQRFASTSNDPLHGVARKTFTGTTTTATRKTTCLFQSTTDSTRTIIKKDPIIDISNIQSILSAGLLIIIDILFRKCFLKYKITFPSSLGACGFVLTTLLTLSKTSNMNILYKILQPGSILLAKWLPVFFVPSLIILPLIDSVGSINEIIKISSVIVIGFIISLISSSGSVVMIRQLLSSTLKNNNDNVTKLSSSSTSSSTSTTAIQPNVVKKLFSDRLFHILASITIGSGISAIAASKGLLSIKNYLNPITSLFLLSSTLTTFVFGARLPKSFTKLVHPLVTCTSLTWMMISLFGTITNNSFYSLLKIYRKGYGMNGLYNTGAGDILLFLLGPAVVSLAISMYERRKLISENIIEITTSILTSTLVGIFGTAVAVRYLNIMNPYIRLSLLSRNITSPLAMSIASILGGDVSLAVSFVVVTGLIGANFGSLILDALHIHDPVARGLGIGSAAHGLGTAAFVQETNAFPFAAISMALTATAATITVSIPIIRNIIIQIALG